MRTHDLPPHIFISSDLNRRSEVEYCSETPGGTNWLTVSRLHTANGTPGRQKSIATDLNCQKGSASDLRNSETRRLLQQAVGVTSYLVDAGVTVTRKLRRDGKCVPQGQDFVCCTLQSSASNRRKYDK
jgi:hypothetical protein